MIVFQNFSRQLKERRLPPIIPDILKRYPQTYGHLILSDTHIYYRPNQGTVTPLSCEDLQNHLKIPFILTLLTDDVTFNEPQTFRTKLSLYHYYVMKALRSQDSLPFSYTYTTKHPFGYRLHTVICQISPLMQQVLNHLKTLNAPLIGVNIMPFTTITHTSHPWILSLYKDDLSQQWFITAIHDKAMIMHRLWTPGLDTDKPDLIGQEINASVRYLQRFGLTDHTPLTLMVTTTNTPTDLQDHLTHHLTLSQPYTCLFHQATPLPSVHPHFFNPPFFKKQAYSRFIHGVRFLSLYSVIFGIATLVLGGDYWQTHHKLQQLTKKFTQLPLDPAISHEVALTFDTFATLYDPLPLVPLKSISDSLGKGAKITKWDYHRKGHGLFDSHITFVLPKRVVIHHKKILPLSVKTAYFSAITSYLKKHHLNVRFDTLYPKEKKESLFVYKMVVSNDIEA